MARFVGRRSELKTLDKEVARVTDRNASSGRCLLMRGRRRVGKSRLTEKFCDAADIPYAFFTASRQGAAEPNLFADDLRSSNLPNRELLAGLSFDSWEAVLRQIPSVLDGAPGIIVIDEFPYLIEDDPTLEAVFQKIWDRILSKHQIMLVLIGSDLAAMEALNQHGRAFFQRGTEMVVSPLTPPEVAELVGAPNAADGFDAYLVTGGLPLICDEWPTGLTLWEYLTDALSESTSALVVSGERSLAAEFPTQAQARDVLSAIGSGETTFTNIAAKAGGMQAMSLNRSLDLLRTKRVVTRDVPLSTKASKEARYRIEDTYLRFWLRFIGAGLPRIERGRGDTLVELIRQDWTTWRGRAIEPTVREALARLSPVSGLPAADLVGGYWTRTNDPEIDIIGTNRSPAKTIEYAGTIKWLDNRPLDQSDLNKLAGDVNHQLPGGSSEVPLLAVSRSGVTGKTAAAILGPDDLISAW